MLINNQFTGKNRTGIVKSMTNLVLLTFAVFFTCCILQFWFLKRVRDALIDRHPETFLSIEKSSFFPMQRLWDFDLDRRCKELRDVDLNRHLRNLKRLKIVAIGSWLAFAISIFTVPMDAPRLPQSFADGTYAGDCCGKIHLQNGHMMVAGQRVSYVVERDKQGPYVLPPFYIGATIMGMVVNRDQHPLKLRLNDENRPTEIELMDSASGMVISLQRVS